MEGDEIVEFFGNNPSDCHYMIHDINDVNTHLLELPLLTMNDYYAIGYIIGTVGVAYYSLVLDT